jgi:alkaline phosphatase
MLYQASRRAIVLFAAVLMLVAAGLAAQAEPLTTSAILLIGDGMGPVQIELARECFDNQPLMMERTRHTGTVTTDSAGGGTTDSAAAATALATGYKTNNGMIGMSPEGLSLESLLERAQSMYRSTGVITTDSLTGATPASFIAHVDSRGKREDIGIQVADSEVDIMLGFWTGWFLPKSKGGERTDDRDLLAHMKERGYNLVLTREERLNAKGPRIVGMFDDGPTAPTVAEMVKIALKHLARDPDGYLLVVEGARIDWECHEHKLDDAMSELLAFDGAVVEAVGARHKPGRPLVVITADHETGGLQRDKTFTTTGHTSTPVKIFAFGVGADRFRGELDNTDIPRLIADITGLGRFPASEQPSD